MRKLLTQLRPTPLRGPHRRRSRSSAPARSTAAWSSSSSSASTARSRSRYPHPLLEPILRETYGIIVYQEQVMQIAQALAGYSLGDADNLRRAMGKKKKEEMDDGARALHRRARSSSGIAEKLARRDLRPDGDVRRLRLQQVALGGLRADLLPDRVPEGALPDGVHGRRC